MTPRHDIEAYLQRLQVERGYSAHTLSAYRRDLECLLGALQALPGGPHGWQVLQERDIRRWVAAAARQGLAASSLARRLSVWRGFLDALAQAGRLPLNPARAVRAPRQPRRLPKALPVDQAVQMMSGTTGSGPAFDMAPFLACRDQAMAELLYSSGLRLSELTALDYCWIDDKAQGYRSAAWLERSSAEVRVLGKGSKRRVVPVGQAALQAIDAWLPLRQARLALLPDGDRAALFISQQGSRLSNRSVQLRLAALARRQGLPTHVHPHVLRHSFASHLLQSSGDLRAVQELLGHASIGSTQIYTALDYQHLATVYDAAHPRARRKKPDSG